MLITSTSLRAVQTAEIIKDINVAKNLEFLSLFELSAPDCGNTRGVKTKDILPLSPLEYAEKHNTGETKEEFLQRVSKAWEIILEKSKIVNGDIIVVSHRSVLSILDAFIDGQNAEQGVLNRRKNKNRKHGIWRILEV